jgi:hypothetical protein
MNEIWSGQKLKTEVDRVDVQLNELAEYSGTPPPRLSLWINCGKRPSKEVAQKVQRTVEQLKRIRAVYGDVKVDFHDLAWTRRELRKMASGQQAPIIQQWGIEFAEWWSEQFGFTLDETLSVAQFHHRVLRATIVSQPAQRWLRAITAAVEKELGGASFADYAAKFPDRHTARTAVANQAFAALLAECGKEKILEYLSALLVTGEIRQAPNDRDEN